MSEDKDERAQAAEEARGALLDAVRSAAERKQAKECFAEAVAAIDRLAAIAAAQPASEAGKRQPVRDPSAHWPFPVGENNG